MKFLEIRRHSLRKQGGGSQLSQSGVTHARELGSSMGPFAVVVTSVVPRARETAIAMGFAVDRELVPLLSGEDVYAEMEASCWWTKPQPLAALDTLVKSRGAVWRFGSALVADWRDILQSIPVGSSALMITHSGDIELGLVTCFPDADHGAWGSIFAECEGARLQYAGDPPRFVGIEILRQNPN